MENMAEDTNQASKSTALDAEAEDEDGEPLIDPQILARLKFS